MLDVNNFLHSQTRYDDPLDPAEREQIVRRPNRARRRVAEELEKAGA